MNSPDAVESETFINTRVPPHVRIINGALDEDETSTSGIVLNGRLDTTTLRFLKVDHEYQRPLGVRDEIFEAFKAGKIVPNIEIGVRGEKFATDGDDYIIHSPAYIIDGYQRVGNALRLLELIPNHPIRIFATIHFGTNEVWEHHRFTELNKNVKKVSPNLHMRNMRDTNTAVLTLFGLSHNEKHFPLFKRVCWSQSMQRGEMLTALVLAKTSVILHSHQGALRLSTAEGVADALARITHTITLNNYRKNVHTFFSLINECWPFAAIEYRSAATQVKSTFLFELARMLSRHEAFWDESDRILTITSDDRKKLGKFPINDPQVVNLAGTGGKARNILYQLLVDHMNSGRRTQRLRSRFENGVGN